MKGGWPDAVMKGTPPTAEIGDKGFKTMALADIVAGLHINRTSRLYLGR